ncbi:MAG: ABC transporter ATP-binding protein [Desulfobacteraceae bacterium]|jgi:ABC-type nitrate/sulfonate/bicarbonate transport system ATPase subunit|nr:ABC transporter ATP-binding protein [Desulfobacteraceae bacterium]
MGQIRIENLSKEYVDRRRQKRSPTSPKTHGRRVRVLDGIHLEFDAGEMVCILGPSGCGKSTMLRIIAGFEQPTAGAVWVDDRRLNRPSPDHIFVFQHSGLLPWMTVSQNVELGIRHMEDEKEKAALIQEFVEMVELEGFENHYPYQLSGGMQRRAELARALAVNPEMMIMDEPFSGLDFLTHMKMREEVVNMHQLIGKTILLVTHDIDDALIMGDRVVVLGGRPANVKLDQRLDFSHPRNFEKDEELGRLREEVFLMLGVSYAV